MTRFAGLLLACADLERSIAFYRAAGFDVRPSSAREWLYDCVADDAIQFRLGDAARLGMLTTVGAQIGFIVDDPGTVVQRLLDLGSHIIRGDSQPMFLDPDGNQIQFSSEKDNRL